MQSIDLVPKEVFFFLSTQFCLVFLLVHSSGLKHESFYHIYDHDSILKYCKVSAPLSISLAGPFCPISLSNSQYFCYTVFSKHTYDVFMERFNSICNTRKGARIETCLEFGGALAVPAADIGIMGAILREAGRLNEILFSPKLLFQEIHFRSIDCI